jgi:hypothetical protein
MKTELRVYHTLDRLKHDFAKIARSANSYDRVKIEPYKEIYIPNVLRIVFVTDEPQKVRGYRVDSIFIDEWVNLETRDYLNIVEDTQQNKK